MKRSSNFKYLWDSTQFDYNKEAYRFAKDAPFSPQVSSIIETHHGHLEPTGTRNYGRFMYKVAGAHNLEVAAGNANIRCYSRKNEFEQYKEDRNLWTCPDKIKNRIEVLFE